MKQYHALVIEDNSKNATVLENLLAKQGFTYTEIRNPNQVRKALENVGQVDMVFLDLEMPGQDGYDVLSILRSDTRFQNTPIVACTVHINEMNHAYQSGFHSFIGKPIDPERFPNQVERILSGQHVWERS
jgi:two-component system cell cycle response regulator DivK